MSKRLNSYDYEYAQLGELKSAALLILVCLTGLALVLGTLVWWVLRSLHVLELM